MDIFTLDKSRQLFKLLRTLTQTNFSQLIRWQIQEKMFLNNSLKKLANIISIKNKLIILPAISQQGYNLYVKLENFYTLSQ